MRDRGVTGRDRKVRHHREVQAVLRREDCGIGVGAVVAADDVRGVADHDGRGVRARLGKLAADRSGDGSGCRWWGKALDGRSGGGGAAPEHHVSRSELDAGRVVDRRSEISERGDRSVGDIEREDPCKRPARRIESARDDQRSPGAGEEDFT